MHRFKLSLGLRGDYTESNAGCHFFKKVCFLVSTVFLITSNLNGQTTYSKNYHLIDSFDLQSLVPSDQIILDSALEVYHSSNVDTVKLLALSVLANELYHDVWKSYNLYLDQLVEKRLHHRISDPQIKRFLMRLRAGTTGNIGFALSSEGKNLESLSYYERSLNIFRKIENTEGIAGALVNLGSIYQSYNDVAKAQKYYLDALPLYEQLDNSEGVSVCLNNLGYLAQESDQPKSALKYFERVLLIQKNADDLEIEAVTRANLARNQMFIGDSVTAEKNLRQAIALLTGVGSKHGLQPSYCMLGELMLSKGRADSALAYYDRARLVSEANKNQVELSRTYSHYSQYYYEQKNYQKSRFYANEALNLARKTNDLDQIENNLALLIKIAKELGNYEESVAYYDVYSQLRDSLNKLETKKSVMLQQTNYEIRRQQKELELKEQEIGMLEQNNEMNHRTLIFAGIAVMLLAVVLFVYICYHKRHKKNMELRINSDREEYINEVKSLKVKLEEVKMTAHKTLLEEETPVILNLNELNKQVANPISSREYDVLKELVAGSSNREISDTLCVSVNTIKTHVSNLYKKLGVCNRTEVANKVKDVTIKSQKVA